MKSQKRAHGPLSTTGSVAGAQDRFGWVKKVVDGSTHRNRPLPSCRSLSQAPGSPGSRLFRTAPCCGWQRRGIFCTAHEASYIFKGCRHVIQVDAAVPGRRRTHGNQRNIGLLQHGRPTGAQHTHLCSRNINTMNRVSHLGKTRSCHATNMTKFENRYLHRGALLLWKESQESLLAD